MLAILPSYELVILHKFRKDWQKIEDFLVIVKFWASLIFFSSVSKTFAASLELTNLVDFSVSQLSNLQLRIGSHITNFIVAQP